MIRKKKMYLKPRRMFELTRIQEENALRTKYGLKNKLEIWKTLAKVNYFRHRAKELAKRPLEEQEVLFNKLKALGLKINGTADVLGLQVEDLLKRRFATIVAQKKLAYTPKHARQMITHKNVLINDKVVSSPGYLVSLAEEEKITVKKKEKKQKPVKEESENETAEEAAE